MPRHRRASVTTPDLWMQGYAVALANIWRGWHEGGLVCMVMQGDGITLADLEAGGADEYDLKALREAGAK